MVRDESAVELSFRSGYVEGFRAAIVGLNDIIADERKDVLNTWIGDSLARWSRSDDANGPPRPPSFESPFRDDERRNSRAARAASGGRIRPAARKVAALSSVNPKRSAHRKYTEDRPL